MVEDGELLTKSELCDRLKVSLGTVNRWIESGKLRPIRIGRLVRFTDESVRDFLGQASE